MKISFSVNSFGSLESLAANDIIDRSFAVRILREDEIHGSAEQGQLTDG